jgi:hypothetical protein
MKAAAAARVASGKQQLLFTAFFIFSRRARMIKLSRGRRACFPYFFCVHAKVILHFVIRSPFPRRTPHAKFQRPKTHLRPSNLSCSGGKKNIITTGRGGIILRFSPQQQQLLYLNSLLCANEEQKGAASRARTLSARRELPKVEFDESGRTFAHQASFLFGGKCCLLFQLQAGCAEEKVAGCASCTN